MMWVRNLCETINMHWEIDDTDLAWQITIIWKFIKLLKDFKFQSSLILVKSHSWAEIEQKRFFMSISMLSYTKIRKHLSSTLLSNFFSDEISGWIPDQKCSFLARSCWTFWMCNNCIESGDCSENQGKFCVGYSREIYEKSAII